MIGRSVGRMMLVITVAWLLILSESYVFFFVIRPTAPNIHESVISAVLKISSFGALAVLWVVVLFSLEYFLFRRNSG
ncbi:MAG: hypothetical protein OK449_05065 [Thaumarchaeota archaeon]|nr:hypothetical protein [Nitrososphaerota archaeon]